jgi:hypothetical protein
MSSQSEKQARAEAMLGELAELSLMVAKELAVRLRESEDPEQAVALAGAFQKVSRVVRLTLALNFKLERDAERAAREAEKALADAEAAKPRPVAERPPPHPVEVRKERVSNLLYRLLWNESEGDSEEFEVLQEDLNARLDEIALDPTFETTPIEVTVQRLVADMALASPFTLTVGEPPPAKAEGRQPQLADTG